MSGQRWNNRDKLGLTEVELEGTWAGDVCQHTDKWLAVVNTVMNPRVS